MRKLFTVIMISSIVLVSCGGSNEVEIGNKTTMIVDPVYDAGTVIQGEVITAKIKIKNAGSYPLVIAEVSPGCSCTVSEKIARKDIRDDLPGNDRVFQRGQAQPGLPDRFPETVLRFPWELHYGS